MHRVLLAVVAALVVAGCQVKSTVTIELQDDGSGRVVVAVGLDPEAIAQLPDLDNNGSGDAADLGQMVRVDDLRAAGWEVGAPEARDDGLTWVTATKPFGTPDEGVAVLNELTGPGGALRDWRIERSHSFGRTSYEVTGTADLSAGIEALGDDGLAAALDGEPLGEDAAAIEQRFGKPMSELVTLDVDVALPGSSDPTRVTPVMGGPAVPIDASSTVTDAGVLGLAAVAVTCAFSLVGIFIYRTLRR